MALKRVAAPELMGNDGSENYRIYELGYCGTLAEII